jgi:hypothetical protein
MGQLYYPVNPNYLKTKNPEQKQIITKYFAQAPGCWGKMGAMKDEAYADLVVQKLASLNLKQKALGKIGLDESQVSEIPPMNFSGYRSSGDFFAKRGKDGVYRTSNYESTWVFFGEQQVYVYIYSFSMTEDAKKERTEEYFYKDVTNVSTTTETREVLLSGAGCNPTAAKASVEEHLFSIVVPGDKLMVACESSDTVEQSIQAMKQKLREKKS